MTTTPAPPAGPDLDPSGETPARGAMRRALAPLVAGGTLSAAQADAVLVVLAPLVEAPAEAAAGPTVVPAGPAGPPAPTEAAADRAVVPAGPEPAPGRLEGATPAGERALAPWRGRLLEAAVYLGSAFVLAAVGVVVQQRWSAMPRGGQLLLAGSLAAVALAAGLVVSWPVRPRRAGSTEPRHAVRRRSGSVVLTLGVALAVATVALAVGEGRWQPVSAAGAAVLLMVGVQVLAPSVLAELAVFGAGVALVTAVPDVAMPAPSGEGAAGSFDWEAVDVLRGSLLLGYGAAWAWGASRRLPHRELAVALGLGVGVIGAMSTAAKGQPLAAALLGVLAVAAVLTYLRDPAWPWVVGAVGAVFFAVLLVGHRTLGPALTFLVAGVVLLGGTAAAVALGRWRSRRGGGG